MEFFRWMRDAFDWQFFEEGQEKQICEWINFDRDDLQQVMGEVRDKRYETRYDEDGAPLGRKAKRQKMEAQREADNSHDEEIWKDQRALFIAIVPKGTHRSNVKQTRAATSLKNTGCVCLAGSITEEYLREQFPFTKSIKYAAAAFKTRKLAEHWINFVKHSWVF